MCAEILEENSVIRLGRIEDLNIIVRDETSGKLISEPILRLSPIEAMDQSLYFKAQMLDSKVNYMIKVHLKAVPPFLFIASNY